MRRLDNIMLFGQLFSLTDNIVNNSENIVNNTDNIVNNTDNVVNKVQIKQLIKYR